MKEVLLIIALAISLLGYSQTNGDRGVCKKIGSTYVEISQGIPDLPYAPYITAPTSYYYYNDQDTAYANVQQGDTLALCQYIGFTTNQWVPIVGATDINWQTETPYSILSYGAFFLVSGLNDTIYQLKVVLQGISTSFRFFIKITSPLVGNAGMISGQTSVCQGQNSVTYNVPEIANATTYIWTLPNGATGTSTTNSITVNYGTSAISGNITVRGSNSYGDGNASSLAITVNALPVAAGTITGDAIVCQEQNTLTYTVPTIANATSYVWTLPSGATGTSTTNSIDVDFGTTAISGDITVKGTNNCGDGATSTLAITVNPLPLAAGTITGDAIVCQGQTVNYNVPTVANATSYVWTLPSGATGTSTTNAITVDFGTSATTGDITVKGANSCGDGTASTLPITVNIKPTTPIITLNGLVLQSDALVGNQWFNQNGLINGATNQNHTVTVDGDYYVIVSLSGCSSDPSNTINVTVTGIEVFELGRVFKVYPNPVLNELIIEIEGNNETVNFDILNAIGQVVFKGNLVDKTTVQTSDFSHGVYLIKLENGKTFEFKKIIKE